VAPSKLKQSDLENLTELIYLSNKVIWLRSLVDISTEFANQVSLTITDLVEMKPKAKDGAEQIEVLLVVPE